MKLTNIKIKSAKPREKAYKLSDGGGLYLQVAKAGGKYWRLKYRYFGKEKLLSIGVYPQISLDEARKARDRAKALLRDGIDPSLEKQRQNFVKKEQSEITFEFVAREWIARNAGGQGNDGWTAVHTENVTQSLEKDVFPAVGNYPVDQISTPMLKKVVQKIEHRGAGETARRVTQRIKAIYRYASASGYCTSQPAENLKELLRKPKKGQMAALKPSEMPEYLAKLDLCNMSVQTRLAMRLMALTFVRNSELREAKWDEIDWEAKLWVIPAERMKKKDNGEHVVPLSRQALDTLRQLETLNGNRGFLFPMERQPTRPMSDGAMGAAIKRIGYRGRMTVHGYRSVASSVLNESGLFNPDAIERQLHHKEKNQIRAAYNRAEYLDERVNMMQWWADWLDGCRQKENVTYASFG